MPTTLTGVQQVRLRQQTGEAGRDMYVKWQGRARGWLQYIHISKNRAKAGYERSTAG